MGGLFNVISKLAKPVTGIGAGLYNLFKDKKDLKNARKARNEILKEKEEVDKNTSDLLYGNQESKEALFDLLEEAYGRSEEDKLSTREGIFDSINNSIQKQIEDELLSVLDPQTANQQLQEEYRKSYLNDKLQTDLRTTLLPNEATRQAVEGGSGSKDRKAKNMLDDIMMQSFENFRKERKQNKRESIQTLKELGEYLVGEKSRRADHDFNKMHRKVGNSLNNLTDRGNLSLNDRNWKGETLGMKTGANAQDLGAKQTLSNQFASTIGQGIGGIFDAYNDHLSPEAKEKAQDQAEERRMKKGFRDFQYSDLLKRYTPR